MSDSANFLQALAIGPPWLRPTVDWAPETAYYKAPNASAVYFDGSLYECKIAHVSGDDFAADLDAGKWQIVVSAQLSEEGLAASAAAVAAAEATAEDAAATAGDRTQTGLDRVATGQDKTATDADRAATGQDRTATAADRVQTGLDRIATGQDSAATAADRVQTGSDRSAAATSATDAASARDASILNAQTYATEAAGRAAVADGVTFDVQGSGDIASYRYRRTNSTTSALIAIFPSKGMMDAAHLREVVQSSAVHRYIGSATTLPIITVEDGSGAARMVYGWDTIKGEVVIPNRPSTATYMGDNSGMAIYSGDGSVLPIVVDAAGRVALGFDRITGEMVGSAVASSYYPAKHATNGLFVLGQSLSVGGIASTIVSAAQPYSNITFAGGPRASDGAGGFSWSPLKPLVEDTVVPAPDAPAVLVRGETPCSGAAKVASQYLAARGIAPANHVILSSTGGKSGASIAQIMASDWWPHVLEHISNAHSLATDYAVQALCWVHGTADASTSTSQASYLSQMVDLFNTFETEAIAITGQNTRIPFLIAQLSEMSRTTGAGVNLAQLQADQDNDNVFLITPSFFLPSLDGTHLSDVGYCWLGGHFGRAYGQLALGQDPTRIMPLGATFKGATVRWKFQVPVLPLVFDETNLPVATTKGFKVLVNGSAATISSLAIDGDTVVITLVSAPAADAVVSVRLGMDYAGAGVTMGNTGAHCLRDSGTETMIISGTTYPLWHVAPHCVTTATNIGV